MSRIQLLWFGKPPSETQTELVRQHGLTLVVQQAGQVPDFRFACAALFWATDGHFSPAAVCLRDHLRAALDDGAYVAVVISPSTNPERMQTVLQQFKSVDPNGTLETQYRPLTEPVDLHTLLHQVLLHAPGAARNVGLEFTGDVELDEPSRFLLQRAFHDCISVELKSITPGFSKAETFIVRATLKDSFAGPEPRPFFAKMGDTAKLQVEMRAFQRFAEHHVPWYLRPNFVPGRIAYGVEQGILVGSFVPDSLSLGEAVRLDGGEKLISSLFTETLAGLRQQQQVTAIASQQYSVVSALKEFCKRDRAPAGRCQAAARMFGGAAVDADALWWRLIDLPERPWRSSAIHGDLHVENVRVRKSDAILIDFAHARVGPAAADLAQLEVSLAFDTMEGDPQAEYWRSIVDGLYSADGIRASLKRGAAAQGQPWIHRAVAQVRSFASASVTDPDEYMRVLAVYLLRQACYPASQKMTAHDEYRRTFAHWLACRLTANLEVASPVQALAA